MKDEIQAARHVVDDWHLGQTSANYESNSQGAGAISTGKGDLGGVSYGSYQLSTRMGTLREYLDQSRYREAFLGLVPATPAFNAKWKELAKAEPGFSQDQHDFIGRSHYGEQNAGLKAVGIDLSGRGRAVQDTIWSTSVQFRGLTPRIFAKGLAEKFGGDYELPKLSDRDIVEAVQDYKIAHNASLFKGSPEWQSGLLKRANAEKASLVRLATQEKIAEANGVEVGRPASAITPVHAAHRPYPVMDSRIEAGHVHSAGERSKDVRVLQERLSGLGYSDAHGYPLKIDGDFGRNTAHAVRAFQQAHSLDVDGVVGLKTMDALRRAKDAPLLSERTHPDTPLFQEAKSGLRKLPAGTFESEFEMVNAAGALASKARQFGMSRIDHVLLNTRGDGLIAVQGDPQGPARHLVSVDKAQAASQSVAQSTVLLAGHATGHEPAARAQLQMEHMEHRAGLSIGMRP